MHNCPVAVTTQVFAGKWKPLILWHLMGSTLRFSDLEKEIPAVTQKMLTQQLRELEKDGLVNRLAYAEVPPRVEYSLSEYGRTLIPILLLLFQWGKEHQARTVPGQ